METIENKDFQDRIKIHFILNKDYFFSLKPGRFCLVFFVREKFEVGRLLSVRSGKSEQATIYCLRHKKLELKKLLLKLKKKKLKWML